VRFRRRPQRREARERGLVFDVVPADKFVEEAKRLLDWANTSGDWKEDGAPQADARWSERGAEVVHVRCRPRSGVGEDGRQLSRPLAAIDAIAKAAT